MKGKARSRHALRCETAGLFPLLSKPQSRQEEWVGVYSPFDTRHTLSTGVCQTCYLKDCQRERARERECRDKLALNRGSLAKEKKEKQGEGSASRIHYARVKHVEKPRVAPLFTRSRREVGIFALPRLLSLYLRLCTHTRV